MERKTKAIEKKKKKKRNIGAVKRKSEPRREVRNTRAVVKPREKVLKRKVGPKKSRAKGQVNIINQTRERIERGTARNKQHQRGWGQGSTKRKQGRKHDLSRTGHRFWGEEKIVKGTTPTASASKEPGEWN